ncbi:uncharacterized protein LOC106880126 [Octopus bimaculoides]|uniref:uncharacterized protein LOC106880126 n=1 Tax=Octopus bimaculoides TaxID=37653 RepID=UPI0022DFDAC5|nr:uncharacterized protein LOC106880126 [Octopus bimaculoides]
MYVHYWCFEKMHPVLCNTVNIWKGILPMKSRNKCQMWYLVFRSSISQWKATWITTTSPTHAVFYNRLCLHSFAVKVLPSYLESFLKDLTSYFSQSGKRQNDFNKIQSVVGIKENKIPKLSQTRWLSCENVIDVIIEQWDALVLYFQSEDKIEQVDGAKRIYETMINKGTKHMLLFLHYILKKVNALNVEFQLEHFRLHLLHILVSSEYKNILGCFIKEDVLAVSKLSDIDLNNTTNLKDTSNIYLSGRIMRYLEPNPIVGDSARFITDSWRQTFQQLHQKTLDELANEWRSFRQYKNIPVSSKSIPELWHSMNNLKDGLDHSKFERLSQFMTNLTVLPHSSPCKEHIFFQVNCTKTKFTNRLKAETITDDRLLTKETITRKGASCISWEPSAKLIKDVVHGFCHRRYTSRLNSKKEGVNEDDMDMYEIDN